jgi:glyoxylase-like metal-dependent hydrolase (beta-lactamase superfamily II)
MSNPSGPSGPVAGTPPGFDPVPESSVGPTIPERGYFVGEAGDRFYFISDGTYQCAFVVTGQGVIAIDAPPSIGRHVTEAIRSVTDEPITHVVYTHSHGDHIGTVDQFPDSAVRIGHAETKRWLDRLGDRRRKPPEITFDETYRLEVGDRVLQLDYRGGNHALGNIFIHAPEQRVLMIMDVFYPGWVPFSNLAQCRDVPGFIDHHDYALEYDFDALIGGHLTRLGTREDVVMQREYIHDLKDFLQKVLDEVDLSPSWELRGNPYAMLGSYFNKIASAAAEEILAKWRGRLGGVDVMALNHATTMLTSLRVDFNVEPSVPVLPPRHA